MTTNRNKIDWIAILKAEWDRMQPGRYQTLTESDEDAAWMRGFESAMDFLVSRADEEPETEYAKEQLEHWRNAGELFGRINTKIAFGKLTMNVPAGNPVMSISLLFKVGDRFCSVDRTVSFRPGMQIKALAKDIAKHFKHEAMVKQNADRFDNESNHDRH